MIQGGREREAEANVGAGGKEPTNGRRISPKTSERRSAGGQGRRNPVRRGQSSLFTLLSLLGKAIRGKSYDLPGQSHCSARDCRRNVCAPNVLDPLDQAV